ncbi:MAG: hypothetical protein K0Q96_657 [Rubrobacteraceae bacterium]|nr:hypothetical protein [Rubrobacteraceae bacterium]
MKTKRTQKKQTTLVLGATGKTGRRVALRLATRGVPTRVGSRSGEPPFDWEDKATWAPALRDVESVYVSNFPDLAVPGTLAAVRSFAELAEQDVPAEFVWLLTYLFSEVLDGRNVYLTDGVQRALGREPKDFTVYAREAPGVRAGRWGLLRLLDVRDGSTEATEAGGGDRRDAVDQHTGGHPRLHDGAIRDCRC